PILDNPITDIELCKQIQDMKSDRAGGPDGLPPGVLKLLPANWLIMLTCLLNRLFADAIYPQAWVIAKMFTIFKKGNRLLPENYRVLPSSTVLQNCMTKFYVAGYNYGSNHIESRLEARKGEVVWNILLP
ncbi:unnamed protein product, partial [Meganyctiphanes norvegica]